jgi:hypothetical protein
MGEITIRQRHVQAFDVSIPKRVDLAFDFDTTRCGFDGIIVEAKSGTQGYDKTIPQLRTYRAARSRRDVSRYLVWGIVENPGASDATFELVAALMKDIPEAGDLWLFSSADAIPVVLTVLAF